MLGSVLAILRRLSLITAWLLVAGAVGLLVIEESNILADILRLQARWRLGEFAGDLRIGRVTLKWFEPGIIVEDITVRSTSIPRDGIDSELVRLNKVHVRLNTTFDPRELVESVTVRGGRLRVSDSLFASFRKIQPVWSTGDLPDAARIVPPPVFLDDFEIVVDLPDGTPFPVGRVDLVAEPDAAGDFQIRGRLLPTHLGPNPKRSAIYLWGVKAESSIELFASARELPLEVPAMFSLVPRTVSPVSSFRGRLTLEAHATLDFDETAVPSGTLRASFDEATIALVAGPEALEDVQLELDARFAPGIGGGIWRPESWSVTSRVDARARGRGRPQDSGIRGRAWALYGQHGGDTMLGRMWARVPHIAVGSDALLGLGLPPITDEVLAALAPRGSVDALLDLRLRRPHPGERGLVVPEIAVHLTGLESAEVRYAGFRDATGAREGLPVPFEVTGGELLYSYDRARENSWVLGLSDLAATRGAGSGRGAGILYDPARDSGMETAFDFRASFEGIPIDETLREAMAANPTLASIWPTYRPEGGTVSGTWAFHEGADVNGFTGWGELSIEDTRIAWEELPVPMENASGELEFRWSSDSVPIPASPASYRPSGLVYRFWNERDPQAPLSVHARIDGFARLETPLERAPTPVEEETALLHATELALDDVLLRGRDWDILAAAYPDMGLTVSEYKAKGSVQAGFYGSRGVADTPYVASIEVNPKVVEVTPEFFPRRTKDLEGRLLIRTRELMLTPAERAAGLVSESEFEARLAIAGEWPGNVALAAHGHIPFTGTANIFGFGAGIDPSNLVFRGAFEHALTLDEESSSDSLDLSDQHIGGTLDFRSHTTFEAGSEDEEVNVYRVFLRHNELESEGIRLRQLHGPLDYMDDVLRSARIEAAIGDHPIELQNVMIFRLGDSHKVPEADPLLLRPGFWNDPDGSVLQAELYVKDLPLDESHLSAILDAETLEVLRESASWDGTIDVLGARILVSAEQGGTGKFAVHGKVRPNNLMLRYGFPIRIEDAEVDLREIVLEGGRVRGWGRIEGLRAEIAERDLENAHMIVSYIDGRLTIDDLGGTFEGGKLASLGGEQQGGTALAVDLSEPYGFDLRVELEGVHVDSLLRGVFHSSIADSGQLDVGLRLKGKPGEVLGITGSGWLSLDDGQLWSIPAVRALFGQLGLDKTAVFDTLRARFQIRDGVVTTPELRLKSDLVYLIGEGDLDFTGSLRYDLEVRYGLLDRLGPFGKILYWLNNSLWRVNIRGDMDRPRVVIRNTLFEFLRGFEERKNRALPLPAFSQPPERF